MSIRLFPRVLAVTFCWFASLASAQEDLVYVAVDPCRIADTRKSTQGVIVANTERDFRISGTSSQLSSQGGEVNCLHPKENAGVDPVAVAAYIIAVSSPSSAGNGALSVYPSNLAPPPPGSGTTVNFTEDTNTGNTTIATLCETNCPGGRELSILARNSDRDVVIDVQGYFYSAKDNGRCTNGDLTGSWQTFVAESSIGGSTCLIEVSNGSVVNGNCDSTFGPSRVTGGQLSVDGLCNVQGSIFVGQDENFLNAARLSIDRNLITGIVSIEGLITHFTASRR
jgi:hypothetical protein